MYDVRIKHGIYYKQAVFCSVVWSKTKLVHTPSTGGFHKFLNMSGNYAEEEFLNAARYNDAPVVIRVHDIILFVYWYDKSISPYVRIFTRSEYDIKQMYKGSL